MDMKFPHILLTWNFLIFNMLNDNDMMRVMSVVEGKLDYTHVTLEELEYFKEFVFDFIADKYKGTTNYNVSEH